MLASLSFLSVTHQMKVSDSLPPFASVSTHLYSWEPKYPYISAYLSSMLSTQDYVHDHTQAPNIRARREVARKVREAARTSRRVPLIIEREAPVRRFRT